MANNKEDENDIVPIYPEIQELSLIRNHNVTNDAGNGQSLSKSPGTITVKVVRPGTEPINFVMKMSIEMKRLMEAYCKEMGFSSSSMRFLFDGKRIENTDTPESLDLENYDVIDAFQLQFGGSRSIFENSISSL